MTKRYQLGALALGVVLLSSACLDRVIGPTQTVLIDQSQPQPGASPSPGPSACEVKVVALGSAGDDFQLSAGGSDSVSLVVTLLGSQGIELPDVCRNSATPSYSQSGPCNVEGSGFNARVTGSAAGTCDITARVGGVSSLPLRLTVVP